jgi:fatty acid desaturase
MATEFAATNAASSGVKLDRKIIKELSRRSDTPGLIYLAQWLGSLLATGYLVWLSLGTWWVWPAMVLYGTFLCVPTYAISHETAHGTAFRSRWLNEAVLWVTSLIYFEEPLHRRYTHTNHHSRFLAVPARKNGPCRRSLVSLGEHRSRYCATVRRQRSKG